MVIDKLTRIKEYIPSLPCLEKALACLEQARNADPGRYEFPGGFILIQTGTTSPVESGDFEAHRKYLDVQILLEGAETIAWADIDELAISVPYSEQIDRSSHSGSGCVIPVKAGMFYICYPHDAHKCCCHTNVPTTFRKAVVKLRLETESCT